MPIISPKQLILLVEDSFEDFEVTKRIFSRSGITNPIQRCTSGDEALDYLFRRGMYSDPDSSPRPGMIILDLNLPGTDGRDVLKTVKSDSLLKKIPTIILTTSSDERDIEACYQSGANSYMIKPVDLDGFMQAIQRLSSFWFETVIFPKPLNGQ